MQGWPLSVPGRWRIMRSNGLSVKFIGLTSLFSQRQHPAPLQRMIKELPTFLRPCRVQLFHLGTIAALEPERQAGRIAFAMVFRIQHPLAVGSVLDAVQMQQPIEYLCSAAVLFGDLRSRHQRIGIAQLRLIATSASYAAGAGAHPSQTAADGTPHRLPYGATCRASLPCPA